MGILYIVATPIGNLKDITIRALEVLFLVDYIVCEDTRRTGQLLEYYRTQSPAILGMRSLKQIVQKPKFISYYDEVEYKKIPETIRLLTEGKDVALVSDGGTPLISDPGFKLVQECVNRGIKVISIPGASSVISALVSSGLPTNNFWFLGYLPSKTGQRRKLLSDLFRCFETREQKPTLIFFEAPHRIQESLTDICEVFGDIEIVIAKELTKIHEEVWKGKITTAIKYFSKSQGEIVILFNIPLK